MTRKNWQKLVDDRELKVSQIGDMLSDWLDTEEKHKEAVESLEGDIEDLKLELAAGAVWGNCRRGCPPAYLNRQGFCSPACELGAPRGEFVTVQQLGVILD